MDNNSLESILLQIKGVKKKYEEIEKIKCEKFNIFSILNLESDEVRLHSKFISELLNTQGSHLQGDAFLKLFLKFLPNYHFNCENVKVETEKATQYNRRIDIHIKNNKNQLIIIENKIYAPDLENQLYNYHNYAEENCENFRLIYLTLKGTEPNIISTGNKLKKDEHYICLSYKDVITQWISDCQKEVFDLPIIRETLKQYLLVINSLTNQSSNKKYIMELVELLKTKDFYLQVGHINQAMKELKILSLAELFEEFEEQLTEFKIKYRDEEPNDYHKLSREYYENNLKIFGIHIEIPNSDYILKVEINNTIYLTFKKLQGEQIVDIDEIDAGEIKLKNIQLGYETLGGYWFRPNIANNDLRFKDPKDHQLKIFIDMDERSRWINDYIEDIKLILAKFI